MAYIFFAGKYPMCSGLFSRVVSCSTDGVPHFHVVESGARLNNLLEPEPGHEEIPLTCIRNFCTLMMCSNGEMSNEIHNLYWQCKNCLNLDGGSQILEPEATFCTKCTEDKLSTAESVVMELSQVILKSWSEVQEETASPVDYTLMSGRDLRELAYSPHNREGSGLLEKAWEDPRGQAAADGWGGYIQLYSPINCFCSPVQTEKFMYQWNGEYLSWETDEPIDEPEGEEISTNHCETNKLSGLKISDTGDYHNNLLISDNLINNPTMSNPNGNDPQATGSNRAILAVPQLDGDRREDAVSMEEEFALPTNGSKSLVTAKKGFTKFFKSIAYRELSQHCSHPSCFSKALTLSESYEAVTLCRVITLLELGERGVAEFATLSWIPQGIKGATLSDIRATKDFLLRKAAHTPGFFTRTVHIFSEFK